MCAHVDTSLASEHIRAVVARPHLALNLQKISLGDSDTGNGASLTDSAVQSLLLATPNLRVLALNACTRLTDTTLFSAVANCPNLEYLAITGNDKIPGRITPGALKYLTTATYDYKIPEGCDQAQYMFAAHGGPPELVPKLRVLELYDQKSSDA